LGTYEGITFRKSSYFASYSVDACYLKSVLYHCFRYQKKWRRLWKFNV